MRPAALCLIVIGAALTWLGAGCNDRDVRLYEFEVQEQLPAAVVDGNPVSMVFPGTPIQFNADMQAEQEFQQQELDYVARVAVTGLQFSITANSTNSSMDSLEDGNPDNFDWVNSVDLYIEATVHGQPQEVRVAFLESTDPQIGSGATTLVLRTTGVDIQPFVEAAGGYTIRVDFSGTVPPDDVHFDGLVTYTVVAGLDRD